MKGFAAVPEDTRVTPEERLEMTRRQVAETEAAVERQMGIVEELQKKGENAEGAIKLLALLRSTLKSYRAALAAIEIRKFLTSGFLRKSAFAAFQLSRLCPPRGAPRAASRQAQASALPRMAAATATIRPSCTKSNIRCVPLCEPAPPTPS